MSRTELTALRLWEWNELVRAMNNAHKDPEDVDFDEEPDAADDLMPR